MRNKISTSFRLSQVSLDLLKGMSEGMGISQADVIEFALRDLSKLQYVRTELNKKQREIMTRAAKQRGVTLPEIMREAVNVHLTSMGYLEEA